MEHAGKLVDAVVAQVGVMANHVVAERMDLGSRTLSAAAATLVMLVVSAVLQALGRAAKHPAAMRARARRAAARWFCRRAHDPLDFCEAEADADVPLDKRKLLPYVLLGLSPHRVLKWFEYAHSDRFLQLAPTESQITLLTKYEKGADGQLHTRISDSHVTIECKPVWRNADGAWVFLTFSPESSRYELMSASRGAIEACMQCILAHTTSEAQQPSPTTTNAARNVFAYNRQHADCRKQLGKLHPNATFDALFFPTKAEVMDRVTRFQSKTLAPSHTALQCKLYLLLHGPAGTGKTSLAAAVAHALKRDLVLVDAADIRQASQLDDLARLAKTHVVVLDELDCVPALQARGAATPKDDPLLELLRSSPMAALALAHNATAAAAPQRAAANGGDQPKSDKDSPPTLAHWLSMLDGILDMTDAVILAQTNHPERLDPALLRPMRFGARVEMGYATPRTAAELLTFFLQLPPTEVDALEGRLQRLRPQITPAAVLQLAQLKPLDFVVAALTEADTVTACPSPAGVLE